MNNEKITNQPEGKSQPFYTRVTSYLYLLTAVGLVAGQVNLINEMMGKGLLLTFISFVPLIIAMLGEKRLRSIGKQTVRLAEAISEKVKNWEKDRKEKVLVTSIKPEPIASVETTEKTIINLDRDNSQIEKTVLPVRKKPEFTIPNPFAKLADMEVKVPRVVPLAIGILFILAAQPFLFMEKFFPAIVLIIPGLFFFLGCFIKQEQYYVIKRLDIIAKTILLGLPGIALIVFGNIVLIKYIHVYWQKELIGLSCNALGIIMLLGIMPSKFEDPYQLQGNPWDYYTDEAKSKWGILLKVLFVISGLVLFFMARHFAGSQKLWHALWSTMGGLALIQLSFPWKMVQKADAKPIILPLKLLLNLARLIAFGLAIYMAYQGQKLMAIGQLTPSLVKFGFAAIGLVFALREPEPGKEDLLKEKPLKWYWELLGLAVVVAIAVWLRTHLLDIMPYGIEGDEAAGHVNASEILRGQNYSIIAHPAGQPIFYLIHLKLASMFFGLDNLGVKFHALYYGIIDIFALFLFARMLYGPRAALATALLLALSRWHIHFSRFGYGNTLLILLLMMGFYFFLKALKSRNKWHFTLAGMAWAFSLQTEVAARLLPAICIGIMLYLAFRQRHFFVRNWKPLIVLFLGVWLVGGGMLMLFGKSSTALMGRARSVSIFSQDPNAPTRNIAQGFIGSIKSSLTMLNWKGDFRTRHNGGLSGEPMLDFWTGLLFMLGFGFSIYYWKRLRYFVPLIWFFGFMCASIFAIEAPQGHRAFGIVPAVFLMIGAFLDRSRRFLQETLGKIGVWIGVVALVLVIITIGKINYKKYFDTWPGYDTNCTAAAKFIGRQHPDAEHYVMSAYLWQGHPPFMLYAGKISGAFYYASSEMVPVTKNTERDVVYTALLEYPPLIDTIKTFYPKGEYTEEIHPRYGSQFKAWAVSNEEIMKTRGLTARYYNNLNWQGTPEVIRKDKMLYTVFNDKAWPLHGNGSVDWEGSIYVPHEGDYTIYLYATDTFEVMIGKNVFRTSNNQTAEKKVWLSGGLNKIKAKATRRSSKSGISLAWSSDVTAGCYLYKDPHQQPFTKEAITDNYFFTYKEPLGLLGTFYSNNDWTGNILHEKVEPALLFSWMGRPYGFNVPLSVDWRGTIIIDEPGDYKFGLDCAGYGEVEINRKKIWQRGTPPANHRIEASGSNSVYLKPGRYPIHVRWSWQHTSTFKFWWVTPKGKREIVPALVLRPAVK